MRLANKVALITGGASGIGRATALLFAREGAAVSVVDLEQSGGQAIADQIVNEGGRAIYVRCDVSRAADCQRAVEQTVQKLGGLDILFNNAGIIRRASVLETTEEEWDQIMAVNVKSVFLLSKYAIPVMSQARGGVIINTASGWGLVGGRKAAAYCASKGAVVLLTKAMALDHAVCDTEAAAPASVDAASGGRQNIRVNCICPGDTDTPMLRHEALQLGESDEQYLAAAAERPLQRIGTPEDIAQAALYLASDASSFVTGTALVVDGGGLAG